MENQDYKDELSKDEKEEQLLIRSAKAETQNIAKAGFLMAVVPYALILFMSFISNCLLATRGVSIFYKYQTLQTAIRYICMIVGTVGLILSVMAYIKSSKDKDDIKVKVFSSLGMGFGAINAWLLVSDVIYHIIQAIIVTIK